MYEMEALVQQHKDNLKELRRKYTREINQMESDQEKQREEQMARNKTELDSIVVREAEERRSVEEATRSGTTSVPAAGAPRATPAGAGTSRTSSRRRCRVNIRTI